MSTITPTNLGRYWTPGHVWGHDIALAPMLAVHAAYRVLRLDGQRSTSFRWEWDDAAAVDEGLTTAWHMTGRWQARRAVSVSRSKFDSAVREVVPGLAANLNRQGIACLADLGKLHASSYRRVNDNIHEAVCEISRIRKTRQIEPVLGSKVLHHYFPSVVPVFDTALIRKGVLKTKAMRAFLEHEAAADNADRWLAYDDPGAAGGKAMLEFHRYFAFAASEIASTPKPSLRLLRDRFGQAMGRLAPAETVNDKHSVIWRMDAKLAEYCLIGEAYREGHIKRR